MNTFGNPYFTKTAAGDAINGDELSEYGLMAAYSVLGFTNRVYIQRANVDLELEASLVRPTGAPNNGSYWLDTSDTSFGVFEWNSATNTFDVKTPIIITDVADLETVDVQHLNHPKMSIGSLGDYAVVALNANNPLYKKVYSYNDSSIEWELVGSDDWKESIPSITGTVSSATFQLTDT